MSSKVTQRDYEIFQHVLRYRISSREAIHRVLFPKVTINAVTKVTVRLQAQNWLNRYPSVVPQCYFTLTPQTALLLGVSETAVTSELAPADLLREYSVMAFCCLSDELRHRLMSAEVEEEYAALYFPSLDCSRYYLNQSMKPALAGICFVDDFIDKASEPKACVARCIADITQRCRRASFRDYIAKNRFEMAIITSTRERAAALRTALKAHELPTGMRTAIGVVPRMINMMPRPSLPASAKRGSGPKALSNMGSTDGHNGNGHVNGHSNGHMDGKASKMVSGRRSK